MAETLAHAEPEGVVLGVDRGFKIGDRVGAAGYGIEDRAHWAADDEPRAEVVNTVSFHQQAIGKFLFDAQIELLDHRAAHAVVDDVDARRAGTGEREAAEGAGEHLRRAGREGAVGVQVNGNAVLVGGHIARGHVERQRAAVETAFQ